MRVIFIICALCLVSLCGVAGSLEIDRLRCEYLEAPQSVDTSQPVLGWVLNSDQRGQMQTAYQVLVSDCDGKVMWDSGKVESAESSHVNYSGQSLRSSSDYHWKVRVWDKEGQPSAWSAPAHFGTALMDAAEWKAKWIGRGPPAEPVVRWGTDFVVADREKIKGLEIDRRAPLFRKEFVVKGALKSARIHICGLGLYELYVNGNKIGAPRVHTPLKTLYSARVFYDTLDITDALAEGENALGVMLGDGWFSPPEHYWGWRMQWWGFPKLIAQVELSYTNGSRETIITDGSWKSSTGPVLSNSLFDGEVYDARAEQSGWNKQGFDDSRWDYANLVMPVSGKLQSQLAPPITITDVIKPKSVNEVKPGVFIFDMGQNFSGWAKIAANGRAGTKIQLRYGENINEDGTLNKQTSRNAKNTDVFILKGQGQEFYEPHFTNHGFRYVEVTGYPGKPTVQDLEGREVRSDCDIVGDFTCSNELINHIYHCALWSQRSIMQGLPLDCAQRDERLGWGDAHMQSEFTIYGFDAHRFLAKWCEDFQSQQLDDGALPHVSPRPGVEGYPCWSAGYPIVSWYCYLYYGDKRLLAKHYPHIRKYVDYLKQQSTCHIQPRDDSGDWKSLVVETRGGPLLMSTAFYYYCAKIVADSAAALGYTEDAGKYGAMVQEIAASFNNVFLRNSSRRGYPYGENTQMENLLPLFFDIVPDKARNKVVSNLIGDIEKKGHLTTGMIGTKYLMETLYKIGRSDVGYRLLVNEDYPGWAYMTKGRTTISESWDAKSGTNNHSGFGGAAGSFLYKVLAGINVDLEHPGFERILIRPYFAKELDYVKASTRTIKGPVESSWRKEDGRTRLTLSIPANTTALVYLPADPSSVTESAMEAGEAPGVRYLRKENKSLIYEIASGRYEFVFSEAK